jgi:predicted dehydrogenase
MTDKELPTLRWGIIGCGLISSWLVGDLVLSRSDTAAQHTIAAIGSSSVQKGKDFVAKHCPAQTPAINDSYRGVYDDLNVEIVYIGTPHPMHHANIIDAIAVGKHVLCENPMAMNAQ